MKNKSLFKQLAKPVIVVAALMAFTSCNRGYGCPTNFSTDVLEVLKSIVSVFF